jgi:hypothetical protein
MFYNLVNLCIVLSSFLLCVFILLCIKVLFITWIHKKGMIYLLYAHLSVTCVRRKGERIFFKFMFDMMDLWNLKYCPLPYFRSHVVFIIFTSALYQFSTDDRYKILCQQIATSEQPNI